MRAWGDTGSGVAPTLPEGGGSCDGGQTDKPGKEGAMGIRDGVPESDDVS